MDDEKESDFATERDSLEGQYTKRGDAGLRTVHGQYTETEADAPDAHTEGEYTGASHRGEDPEVTSTEKRHGNYPKAQH